MADPEAIGRYDTLIGTVPGVVRRGKKNLYTSLNGHMFSFLDSEGRVCVRLSKEDKAAFHAAHGGEDVVSYGAVMQGYVALTEGVDAANWFARSHAYVKTLKPK